MLYFQYLELLFVLTWFGTVEKISIGLYGISYVYGIGYNELYIANHPLDLISSFSILKETFSLVLIKIETKLFLKLS